MEDRMNQLHREIHRSYRLGNIALATWVLAAALFGALLVLFSLTGCGREPQAKHEPIQPQWTCVDYGNGFVWLTFSNGNNFLFSNSVQIGAHPAKVRLYEPKSADHSHDHLTCAFGDKEQTIITFTDPTADGWKTASWSFNDEFTVGISNWDWVTNYCWMHRSETNQFWFSLKP